MSKFAKLLESKNISQKELVKLMGVSKQLVDHWIKDGAIPTLHGIVEIAKTLDVSIEEVVLCFVERR